MVIWVKPSKIVNFIKNISHSALSVVCFLPAISGFSNAFASEKSVDSHITVAAYNIPGVLDSNGSGIYEIILDEVSRRSGVGLTLNYFPAKRALKTFDNNLVDCVIPVDHRLFPEYDHHYQTKALYIAKAYVFTRYGSHVLTGVAALKNRVVGAELGMQLGREVEENVQILRVSSLASLVRMLERKRIDALIAYDPDIFSVFKELNMETLPYDNARPIVVHHDSLMCRITPENRDQIIKIDNEILNLHNNGYIRSVTGQ